MDKFQNFKTANDNVVILQLEGREALENIDDILSVEGADVIFIGPDDLSQSLGYPGEVAHPAVLSLTDSGISDQTLPLEPGLYDGAERLCGLDAFLMYSQNGIP